LKVPRKMIEKQLDLCLLLCSPHPLAELPCGDEELAGSEVATDASTYATNEIEAV